MNDEKLLAALARLEEIAKQSRDDIKTIGDTIVGVKVSVGQAEVRIEGLKESINGLGEKVRRHAENINLHPRPERKTFYGEDAGIWATLIAFSVEHGRDIFIVCNFILTAFLIALGVKK